MRNLIEFVLKHGSLLFLGIATLALILGVGLGAAMYRFREPGEGPRRALKKIDLFAHGFSLAAILAALMPLSNLSDEFLLKIAFADAHTSLRTKVSDNVAKLQDFCWTKQTEEIQQECKNIFAITDLITGIHYELGQTIPKFTTLIILPSDIIKREIQINTEIDTYNDHAGFIKESYWDENADFKLFTIPLTMLAGASAAFAIGLGFFRRFKEFRAETG